MAGKRGIEASVDVDINKVITPMLDMAFQIFAFFIVIYHPSQLEGQMLLNLPDVGQAKAAKPEDARPDQSMAEVSRDNHVSGRTELLDQGPQLFGQCLAAQTVLHEH